MTRPQPIAADKVIATWIERNRDPAAWETTTSLYVAWKSWAIHADEPPGTLQQFIQQIEGHGIVRERRKKGRGFRGLRFAEVSRGRTRSSAGRWVESSHMVNP
jgi:hypothetical protein